MKASLWRVSSTGHIRTQGILPVADKEFIQLYLELP